MLGRNELLELRRRRASRWSFGLEGLRPDWRAKRFKTSVRETTPVRRPDRRAPGMAAAEIADVGRLEVNDGDGGAEEAFGTITAEALRGVEGIDGDGDADSTTHIRCDLVATSFATVWARVEYWVTWKTATVSAFQLGS